MASPSPQSSPFPSHAANNVPDETPCNFQDDGNTAKDQSVQTPKQASSEMAHSPESKSDQANDSDVDKLKANQSKKKAIPSSSQVNTLVEYTDESRRSGRARKQTQRLVQEADSTPSKPTAPASKTSTQTSSLKRKQPLRGNFSSDFLLQNPKSKFAKINLTDLLTQDHSWTCLTRTQQAHLLTLLPNYSTSISAQTLLDTTPPDEPLPNLLLDTLLTNTAFQTDLRLFQEDLSSGRYDPIWLRDAATASSLRSEGKFDDWKENAREAFWGQKQKCDWNALAGDSSIHSLSTLCMHDYLRAGDVLVLTRTSGHGTEQLKVEKEATLTSLNPSNSALTFTFPAGTAKFLTSKVSSSSSQSPSISNNTTEEEDKQEQEAKQVDKQDITLPDIENPKQLSDAILREDGRISTRSANAWKEFRCLRENQDMGSLFDLRELFHARNAERAVAEVETKKMKRTR